MNTRPRPHLRRSRVLLTLSCAASLCSADAIGQCNTVLQSGGPIAALRGQVYSSVLWDPDGAGPMPGMLVAGGTNLTGGDQLAPTGVLAHDGVQWRGLGFGATDTVASLAVFNGDLIAAGSFTLTTATGPANNIARRNGSTWQTLGTGTNSIVNAMAVFAGELIVAGPFSTAGGVATGGIAKWNGAVWSVVSTSLPTLVTNGSVSTMAVRGSLYVGGTNVLSQDHLFRWNGTSWSIVATSNNVVTGLSAINGATQGTTFLFAAGAFTAIGGVAANHVARAGAAVTSWSAMSTGLPQLNSIKLLARTPFLGTPEVLAVGSRTDSTARAQFWNGTSWSTLGNLGPTTGQARATAPIFYGGYVAGLDHPSASSRDPAMFRFENDWTPLLGKGVPRPVQCLAIDGPDLLAGGDFPAIDGVTVNGIARRSGTSWSALGSGVAGSTATVRAVARAANGDVFAGGLFTSAGGNAASNVARWNGSAWSPLGTGTNATVRALLLAANGDLIAGGDFTIAGGVACNRVARWDGTAWSQMGSGMNDAVRCLALLPDGRIAAGGSFVVASGLPCNRIAMWNGSVWSQVAGGMDDAVRALVVRANGELIAGGAFTVAGGNPRPHLARYIDGGFTWLPMGLGVNDTVNALTNLPDGDVLVGGTFTMVGANRLARWDRLVNQIVVVDSGVDGPAVHTLATAPSGEVFIGGDFDAIAPDRPAGHLAMLTTNCPALVTSIPTPCVGPSGPLTLVADTLPWVGSTFRSHATGFSPTSIAISVLGVAPASVPLSLVLPIGLPNCSMLAQPDELIAMIPVAGTSHYQIQVPDNIAFAGVPWSHQFVQLELAVSGAMLSLSSSNALTLVLGLL